VDVVNENVVIEDVVIVNAVMPPVAALTGRIDWSPAPERATMSLP